MKIEIEIVGTDLEPMKFAAVAMEIAMAGGTKLFVKSISTDVPHIKEMQWWFKRGTWDIGNVLDADKSERTFEDWQDKVVKDIRSSLASIAGKQL